MPSAPFYKAWRERSIVPSHDFLLYFSALFLCLAMCSGKSVPPRHPDGSKPARSTQVIRLRPQIVHVLPHDPEAFTQGLCHDDGKLYESTGLYGRSSIRILDTLGMVLKVNPLAPDLFAEGCALFQGDLYQLTWKEQRCLVYSPNDLTIKKTLVYEGEGWGLTSCGDRLIMSNGSDTLYFRNKDFRTVRKLAVTCEGTPLVRINELEYARGRIYANVWFSDYIFGIDPRTGLVDRIMDCSELVAREAPVSEDQVLNGIAFDTTTGMFFCTGKNWRNLFLVTFPDTLF